jgi:hypothetical protein
MIQRPLPRRPTLLPGLVDSPPTRPSATIADGERATPAETGLAIEASQWGWSVALIRPVMGRTGTKARGAVAGSPLSPVRLPLLAHECAGLSAVLRWRLVAAVQLWRWCSGSGLTADLHGQGEGEDEVGHREGDRAAEVDRVPVQLSADDQPQ